MERFVKGDIVVIKFPFTDSSESKKRPALVSANTKDENLILCQITSQERPDPDIITITAKDFRQGQLREISFVRPTILFRVHSSRIEYKICQLKQDKMKTIENKFCEIFTR